MSRSKAEDLKESSHYLRGTIAESLEDGGDKFEKGNSQLLKFHGTYQEDDRDLRKERKEQGLERYFIFMVRTSVPGGALTADQYIEHDDLANDVGNGTFRITSRQGLQLHSVRKKNLKECIRRINECGRSTSGAGGDVVRNVMATSIPFSTPVHLEVQKLAKEFRKTFKTKSNAYQEIWLGDEKVYPKDEDEVVEPIYGKVYLPRKFKIGVVVPPRNEIDVLANDLGFVPHFPNGEIEGYTVFVGGGMGMTHGKDNTYPTLARPMMYVPKERVIETSIAIVTAQRYFGNRVDCRRARLRYLIEERGLDWFRGEVESRLEFTPEDPKDVHFDTVADPYGWFEQGDGKSFCAVWVQDGRIKDTGT
ncbi:MAG: NADPH-dependent assimilatory sulfite reductase hemoprotein subunit, partial [Candidatus Omnitrophica bacterium]|nr:NADPH-dependent assimilatory sulfite reductase hemoprotein subunit [Candidatus Omnitrophota bacterium]